MSILIHMMKRLQILLSEAEMERLRVTANASNVSVGEWVRRAIRRAYSESETRSAETKMLAVREAVKVYAPTADVDQMNREIERGYVSDLP